MVTEAGKELLRNSINTAQFHNKIKEENEMWKHWEMEKGLTMMVSDDDVLKKIRKHHQCDKHRKIEKEEKEKVRLKKISAASSSDRWDHSGYRELYPDDDDDDGGLPEKSQSKSFLKNSCSTSKKSAKDSRRSSKKSSRSNADRWDHSGYKELYPDDPQESPKPIPKSLSERWDHSGYKELYPDSDDSTKDLSSSKKKEKKKGKERKYSKGSDDDTEIYEEFKRYKKSLKEKQKALQKPPLDNHVKEWRKYSEK